MAWRFEIHIQIEHQSPVHTNPFSKVFASTLIVFVSFSPIASVRHFGYSRSSGLAHGRVYWWRHRFQIAWFSPSTLENNVFKSLYSGERFRMAPFSAIAFGVLVWTIAVSGAKQLRFRLKTDYCGRGLKIYASTSASSRDDPSENKIRRKHKHDQNHPNLPNSLGAR